MTKTINKGGRPPLPPGQKKVGVLIKLPPWLIAWMDAQPESRAKLIENKFPRRDHDNLRTEG